MWMYSVRSIHSFVWFTMMMMIGSDTGIMATPVQSTSVMEEPQRESSSSSSSSSMESMSVLSSSSSQPTPQRRRQLFSFWSILFALGPGGCPKHGPLSHHCSSSSTSDSSSSSSSSSSSRSSNSDNGYVVNADNNEGGSSSASAAENGNDNSNSMNHPIASISYFSYGMLMIAAVSAMTAMGAIIVGQRKNETDADAAAAAAAAVAAAGAGAGGMGGTIPGSVARRMRSFNNFMETEPDKVLKMTESFGSVREYEMA